jgi:methanogenic corrinoid protein MtbC1
MPDRGCTTPDRLSASEEPAGYQTLGLGNWCPGLPFEPVPELRNDLARTIESEIIPRLMLAHRLPNGGRSTPAVPQPLAPIVVTPADIEQFCEIIVRKPLGMARDYIDGLRGRGMPLEEIIGSVLSETARHLGQLWENDRCSFVDVTVGLSRLQQLLRVYGPAFEGDKAAGDPGPRILLASIPGEQHTFGLSVVEEYFRRAGWLVEMEIGATQPGLVERLGTEWFDVIGLSASGETAGQAIAALIGTLRQGSLNRAVQIVMGGLLFNDRPELARELGADGGARDANDGLIQVRSLMQSKKIAC